MRARTRPTSLRPTQEQLATRSFRLAATQPECGSRRALRPGHPTKPTRRRSVISLLQGFIDAYLDEQGEAMPDRAAISSPRQARLPAIMAHSRSSLSGSARVWALVALAALCFVDRFASHRSRWQRGRTAQLHDGGAPAQLDLVRISRSRCGSRVKVRHLTSPPRLRSRDRTRRGDRNLR